MIKKDAVDRVREIPWSEVDSLHWDTVEKMYHAGMITRREDEVGDVGEAALDVVAGEGLAQPAERVVLQRLALLLAARRVELDVHVVAQRPRDVLVEAKVLEVRQALVVLAALDGVNGTVFVYGQTGTGKTYTMMGNEKTFNNELVQSRINRQKELNEVE